MPHLIFVVLIAALLALALWSGLRVRREHRDGRGRSSATAAGVYAAYCLHLGVTAAAAVFPPWPIALPAIPSLVTGGVVSLLGIALFVAGVVSFQSFRRVSGMDVTRLVTSGAYRWTRNPQNLGWGLLCSGIAIMGRSWLAVVLALGFWVLFHFYVVSEEAFLEDRFGREYREYCRRTRRYFGLPTKSPPSPRRDVAEKRVDGPERHRPADSPATRAERGELSPSRKND